MRLVQSFLPAAPGSSYFYLMLAKLLVEIYFFFHGKLHVPGAGWLIRRACPFVTELRAYPLRIPGVGTAVLDFRDQASFGMLNRFLGELGQDAHLFRGIDQFLEEGGVLWDVGANVGYFSLYFARRSTPLRALHAFEPNPIALKPLQSLFHQHPWVKIHPVGLGRTDEALEMSFYPGSTPYSSIARPLPSAEKVKIQVRNGDRYRKEHDLELPDVIKIDVEGFEVEVLAGLPETLAAKRPVVFFEHGWLNDEQIAMIRSLVPQRYELRFFLKNGCVTQDQALRRGGDDAVLVPAEKFERLEDPRLP